MALLRFQDQGSGVQAFSLLNANTNKKVATLAKEEAIFCRGVGVPLAQDSSLAHTKTGHLGASLKEWRRVNFVAGDNYWGPPSGYGEAVLLVSKPRIFTLYLPRYIGRR